MKVEEITLEKLRKRGACLSGRVVAIRCLRADKMKTPVYAYLDFEADGQRWLFRVSSQPEPFWVGEKYEKQFPRGSEIHVGFQCYYLPFFEEFRTHLSASASRSDVFDTEEQAIKAEAEKLRSL